MVREKAPSTLGFQYPKHRDDHKKSTLDWIEDRKEGDGAENLWRIHDKLYDFTSFIDKHPGGQEWLQITKGTDITEAFESHHVSNTPLKVLDRFEIRQAKTPRHSPYTFKPNGFYSVLKQRVYEEIKPYINKGPSLKSCLLLDSLLILLFLTSIITINYQNIIFKLISGIFLALTTIAAHNFFHQKDNFRRYYFDISLMSNSSWRISHSLSHHLFPNSVTDLEITLAEPFLFWLPRKDKTLTERYVSWFSSPLIYVSIFGAEFLRRLAYKGPRVTDIIPFTLPIAMYLFAPQETTFLHSLYIWFQILMIGSMIFGWIGFNAAHHHPDIFHDGDTPRADMDWGLAQLDTVRDRSDVCAITGGTIIDNGKPIVVIEDNGSGNLWTFIKIMTSFGHHTLHHMFPTIDHAYLHKLYPILAKTLTEFKVPYKTHTSIDLLFGQFRQLSNNTPNKNPPKYL